MIGNSGLKNLTESLIDLLLRPGMAVSAVEKLLEVDPVNTLQGDTVKTDKMLLDDIRIHGPGVPFTLHLIDVLPRTGILKKCDIRALDMLPGFDVGGEIIHHALQLPAGFLCAQGDAVLLPVLPGPVPDLGLEVTVFPPFVLCACHGIISFEANTVCVRLTAYKM